MYMFILIIAFTAFMLFVNIIDSSVSFTIALILFFAIALVTGLFDYRKHKNYNRRYKLFKEFSVLLILLLICLTPTFIFENPIPDFTSPVFLRSIAVAIVMAATASVVKYLSRKEDEGSE